jgi:hypothetical protein
MTRKGPRITAFLIGFPPRCSTGGTLRHFELMGPLISRGGNDTARVEPGILCVLSSMQSWYLKIVDLLPNVATNN